MMDSCSKCNKLLYYEPTCGGMCMECWENFGRLEIIVWGEETPSDFVPLLEEVK